MAKKDTLTKVLTIIGLVLVWLPVLAPLFFLIRSLISSGEPNFDYLMPAEVFPAVFVGAALLIWAAVRAHAYVKWTAWGLAVAIGLLFGGQGVAVLTGLASGAVEPTGWPMVATMGMLIGYDLAVIFIGVGGWLLMRKVFTKEIK